MINIEELQSVPYDKAIVALYEDGYVKYKHSVDGKDCLSGGDLVYITDYYVNNNGDCISYTEKYYVRSNAFDPPTKLLDSWWGYGSIVPYKK